MPSWIETALQVVGAVASIFGVIGGVIWLRGRKAILAYKRLFVLRVLDNPSAERISVFLDGQEVENPSISALRVWNAGRSPIQPQDFAEPLTLIPLLGDDFAHMSIEGINGPAPPLTMQDGAILMDQLTLSPRQGFEVRSLSNKFGYVGLIGRLHTGYVEDRSLPLLTRWRRRLRRRR